jgi:FKBP-type peptidyl-prolyl cis-trans isomerase SlyD
MLENGQKISLEYTVFLEDGTKIDSNIGEPPLVFVLGAHQVFPALELSLIGMDIGDVKQITLKPEEAYGPIISDAYREVSLETLPETYRQVGAVLGIQDPSGGVYPIRVHEIKDQKAVLDFNHPLAGKSLRFDLKVINAD